MADLTAFVRAQEELRRGPQSQVDQALAAMDERQREQTLAALHDRSITGPAIVRVLTDWGYQVSRSSVQHWREQHA